MHIQREKGAQAIKKCVPRDITISRAPMDIIFLVISHCEAHSRPKKIRARYPQLRPSVRALKRTKRTKQAFSTSLVSILSILSKDIVSAYEQQTNDIIIIADGHRARRLILFAFYLPSRQVIADTEKPVDCIGVTLGKRDCKPVRFIHVIRTVNARLHSRK